MLRRLNLIIAVASVLISHDHSAGQDAKTRSSQPRAGVRQNGSIVSESVPVANTPGLGERLQARLARFQEAHQSVTSFLKDTACASVSSFIRSVEMTHERVEKIDAMFAKLGSRDFFEREAAMRRIRDTPFIPQAFFDKAIAADGLEVRRRANVLLERSKDGQATQLYALLLAIETYRLEGLAAEVLQLAPFCSRPFLRVQLRKTFRATVAVDEEATVRAGLKHADALIRSLCVAGLDQLMCDDADLVRLCQDIDDGVQFNAAQSLINRGNHEGLGTLVSLLNSDTAEYRSKSFTLLRHISGNSFGYSPIASLSSTDANAAESHKQAIGRWQEWLRVSGPTIAWKTPIQVAKAQLGRILCCGYSTNKVYEMDLAGNVIWEQTVAAYPWGCHGLPNGHRVLGSYREKRVTEYDTTGRIVWEKTDLPGGVSCVWRLDSGNTLVTCTDSHRVMEIAPDKKIVWDITLHGRPTDARRLESGNTLVTLQNAMKVIEVDPSGDVVWEVTGIVSPLCAQRLDTGNTLICSTGKTGAVMEVDSTGNTVWSVTTFQSPWCVQRLENGNTLVTDTNGLTEITPTKKKVWFKAIKGIGKLHRY